MKSIGYIFGYLAAMPKRLSASFAEGYDEGKKPKSKSLSSNSSWFGSSRSSSHGWSGSSSGWFDGGGGFGGGGAPEVR